MKSAYATYLWGQPESTSCTHPLSFTMFRERDSNVYCGSVRTSFRMVTHSQYPVNADTWLHGRFVSTAVGS